MGTRDRLLELMQNQEAKRGEIFSSIDTKELRAMRDLAYRLFGRRSMLEMNPGEPGVVYVGCYDREYPPTVPSRFKKRMLVLRGCTHAELVAQARVLFA